ncbi:MAG: hypothetical protein H7330_07705 [Hymenobacteraceae bacterium]|nr:hypothetical protein [Hymenobacteraceae bacterium]
MRTPLTRWWGLLPLLLLSFASRGQSADQQQAIADRNLLDYRLEPILTDERLYTGFLLDYGVALDDLTHYAYHAPAPDSARGTIQTFRRAYATLVAGNLPVTAEPPAR